MLQRFTTSAQRASFLGLLALSIIATLVAIASVATQIRTPSPGFVVWQNLIVPAIGDSSWPGIQAHIPLRAIVTKVSGMPVRTANELRKVVGSVPVGTPLEYEFFHDGRLVKVTVLTSMWRWRDVLPVYLPYWIEGVALLTTALLIFLFRPTEAAARAGTALSAVVGLTMLLALDVFSAAWLQRLCFSIEWLVPAALIHFALCFPQPRKPIARFPVLEIVPYLFLSIPAFVQNWYLASDARRHLAVNNWLYTVDAIAGILSVAALVHAFATSRNARARQQIQVVLTGMVFAAFVPALGLLSITLLDADVPMNLMTPFLLLYPFSIGYAIARHDLFSVDRYLRLGVSYVALSIIVFGSYAGVILAGQSLLGAGHRAPTFLVPVYLVAMLLVVNPLRDRIQNAVDRLFYRQAYNYRATIVATSQALASFLDTRRIAETLLSTLTQEMSVEWAALIVFMGPSGEQEVYAQPPAYLGKINALPMRESTGVSALGRLDAPVLRHGDVPLHAASPVNPRSVALAILQQLGGWGVFPARFEGNSVGLLLLGEKLSGAAFSDEDLQLLHVLANQSALALTNARAYEVIRRTQRELVEAERMAAVGEMAAAVAHGIRNPLAGIRLSAELARDDLEAEQTSLNETLTDIINESDRLEKRVRSIMELTRHVEVNARTGDLATFLSDFTRAARERLPRGIDVAEEISPELAAFPFDRSALGEVLDTIATNAVEAMGEYGRLVVRAGLANGADHNRPREVVVSISDDGPGIDESTVARVFDLFFTTKRSGTGVGLAMAKRLVERQGGTLSVSSRPGSGTTFSIRLPLAR